jgi:hypothetical protein
VVADAGTEPATYVFDQNDNGESYSYWVGALENVDTTDPIDASTTISYLINQPNPLNPSLTTQTNGAYTLAATYIRNDNAVTNASIGAEWRTRLDNFVAADNNNLNLLSKPMLAAGVSGTTTYTNVGDGQESLVGQIAFKPAGSPTATGSATAAVVTKTPIGSIASDPYKTVYLRDSQSYTAIFGAGASVPVPAPMMEDDDLLVVIIGKDDDWDVTPPAGWTLATEYGYNAGAQMYSGVWYRQVSDAASEPAAYTFTSNDDGNEEFSVWVGSFDNVDPDVPFDVLPSMDLKLDTSSPVADSVTTVTDNVYVLAHWYVDNDDEVSAPGGNWTTIIENLENADRNLTLAARIFPAAGPTGNVTVTGASTDDVNTAQIALRPEAVSVANELTDFDLYQNRVIVRHEDSSPLTIADMIDFDNDDENDLPFTASTSSSPQQLNVLPGAGCLCGMIAPLCRVAKLTCREVVRPLLTAPSRLVLMLLSLRTIPMRLQSAAPSTPTPVPLSTVLPARSPLLPPLLVRSLVPKPARPSLSTTWPLPVAVVAGGWRHQSFLKRMSWLPTASFPVFPTSRYKMVTLVVMAWSI